MLLRALDDALIGPTSDGESRTTRHRAILDARSFLARPSKDLTTVCALAGLDPEAVIDRMVARIAAAPSPEDLLDNRKAHRPPKPTRPEPERRVVAVYTMNGQTHTRGMAEIIGIDKHLIYTRLSNGWSVEEALTMSKEEARHRARQTMRDSIEAEVQGRQ